MKLSEQVTNLELSQRLKELGAPQESLFYWFKSFLNDEVVCVYWDETRFLDEDIKNRMICSAFSVAELGEIFPDSQIRRLPWKFDNKWYSDTFINYPCDTEADARAKMLIHLIENNLLKL
jgi:hypothetical protein